MKMKSLDRQIKYYEENIDDLVKKYEGRYLVISEDLNVEAFPTLEEAYTFGESSFGLGNFMLRQCSRENVNRVIRISPSIAFV